MKYSARLALALCFMCCTLLWGCSGKKSSEADHSGPPRDNTPQVLTPSADGTVVFDNDYASIDASNQSQGYIMVSYSGSCEKVKVQITGPDQNTYTYLLTARNEYTTFPLSSGNGTYLIQVMENVGGDSYVVSLTHDVDVQIENEFLPFLYPNQYVDFNADSQAVAKGSELAANTWSGLEVVQNIYNFVIKNISYDTEKATSVSYGYIPNVDDTLTSGTGICWRQCFVHRISRQNWKSDTPVMPTTPGSAPILMKPAGSITSLNLTGTTGRSWIRHSLQAMTVNL